MVCLSFIIQIALLISTSHTQDPDPPNSGYRWIEDDRFYDCVVGISIHGKPSGIGVFVKYTTILTSASPFHKLRDWRLKRHYTVEGNELEVFAINGVWSRHTSVRIDFITGNQSNRIGRAWVKIGLDSLHSTVFDYIMISLFTEEIQFGNVYAQSRYPCMIDIIRTESEMREKISDYGWHFASFAFIDKPHINESQQLVAATFFSEAVRVNCDEWLPRRWGSFVCLANVDNYQGIQSGAPLFNGRYIVGVGAFEISKGNESILVFTRMREYIRYTIFYVTDRKMPEISEKNHLCSHRTYPNYG